MIRMGEFIHHIWVNIIFCVLYRGENGPGGWSFQEVDGEPDQTLYTWIVNSNLKVRIFETQHIPILC